MSRRRACARSCGAHPLASVNRRFSRVASWHVRCTAHLPMLSSLNLERVALECWERLTPAEAASVSLVVRGLSNRSGAQARGVSASTFVNQLSAAYRKLGVTSRRELRARFGHGGPPAHESSCA